MGIIQSKCTLYVQLLDINATLPRCATPGSAGYDLYSAQDLLIPARTRALVHIGISVDIPNGYYGRIAPRSGLSITKSIDIGAGVIDQDYRGPIHVVLINNGNSEYRVNIKDRVAQLILERNITPGIICVEVRSNFVLWTCNIFIDIKNNTYVYFI
jgi:deoxyuridine 5'-triphosphate nucleotidohydrolase